MQYLQSYEVSQKILSGESRLPFLKSVAASDEFLQNAAPAQLAGVEQQEFAYTYPGFVITTRPDGDKDYVNSIRLTDDTVSTGEGVYIGSTEADVTTAYGESTSDTEGMLSYTAGDVALNFILEDGVVTSIEYLPA